MILYNDGVSIRRLLGLFPVAEHFYWKQWLNIASMYGGTRIPHQSAFKIKRFSLDVLV